LPPGTRFLGAQPMPVPQGDRLVWNLENLPAGGERRIKIDVEASRDGDWRTQASLTVTIASSLVARVTGAPPQPPLIQPPPIQPAPVQPGPMVLITAPAPVPVGHPVTFPIRLSNTSGAQLTDAVLRVLLPPGLQHLQGDAIEGSLGDLAPGQSKELTLEAICLQTGKLPIDVTLLSRDKGVFNTQSAVSVTEQPTLALRQTGPIATPLGTEHEFKLEIVNRSSSEVRDVTVTDVLPEGLQYLSGDAGALYDPAARTVRWSVPGLAPGQARQVTFRAAVRGAGPQLNRVSARWSGGQEALLYTIIRVGP